MDLNILNELDIEIEIPSLLQICALDYETYKLKIIEQLNTLGFEGKSYYNKKFKTLDKYVKTFKKHMVLSDDDKFFIDAEDLNANMTFLFVLVNNRNIYKNIDSFTNHDLKIEFLKSYNSNFETTYPNSSIESLEGILSLLNESTLNEKSKWRFLLVMQNPKTYYSHLVELINKNLDAYNKAIKSIEKDLKVLINKYIKYVEKDGYKLLNTTLSNLSNNFTVIPSLVFQSILVATDNVIYLGLYIESLQNDQVTSMGIKGDLVLKLKALSDKSKMDILLLLKSGSKYNLEIAEALNLTPATTSYHMGSLLDCSMVSVTKDEGKCYYHLEPSSIQKLIDELKSTFLS